MSVTERIDEQAIQFEQLLCRQAELYRTLLELARRQAEEISAEDVDAFIVTLAEKSSVIEEIVEIDQSAVPLRQVWDAHRDEFEDETRNRVKTAVEEIRRLLAQLLELESKSQELLGRAKGSIEERFRQLNAGPGAVRTYTQTGDSRSRFVDRTG